MRTHGKLILLALGASLIMALGASGASADEISTDENRFDTEWSALQLTANGSTIISCRVTLEGSFHSQTIRKVPGSLIGHVTRGRTANCSGGGATILASSFPWHITYDSFTGVLPRIERIFLLLHRPAFAVQVFGFVDCLFADDAADTTDRARGSIAVNEAGTVTGLVPDTTITLPLVSGDFGCPEEGGFAGNASVSRLGSTSSITVRLI